MKGHENINLGYIHDNNNPVISEKPRGEKSLAIRDSQFEPERVFSIIRLGGGTEVSQA